MPEAYFEEDLTLNASNNYCLRAMIDHFEKNQAIIKTSDSQCLAWPIGQLPDGCQAGHPVWLKVSTTETDAELAKNLLNQLLKKETKE
ncbi:MAG: hypothetical protein V1692_03105 [bacterium]